MRIDYIDIRDQLVTYLRSVNTATADYDLSYNLKNKVVSIEAKDVETTGSNMISRFPGVFIKLLSKDEDIAEDICGGNVSRSVNFRFQVDCVTSTYTDNDTEIGRLVSNVEANLRDYIAFGNYTDSNTEVMYMYPSNVTFKTIQDTESQFNRSASIEVLINAYVKGI